MTAAGGTGRKRQERSAFSIWPIADPARVRIDIHPPAPAPPSDARLDTAWARLCAANPRLHDGPILALDSPEPEAGRVAARRDTYRRLAVECGEGGGAILVAVRGILLARGERDGPASPGREHVLLGRRGEQTRMYGGTWEFLPAGGVDPPPPEQEALSPNDLIAELRRELREETGLDLPLDGAHATCFCLDRDARGFDVVLRCHLGALADLTDGTSAQGAARGWETDRTAWVPIDALPHFAAKGKQGAGRTLSPVTATLARWLGWL